MFAIIVANIGGELAQSFPNCGEFSAPVIEAGKRFFDLAKTGRSAAVSGL